MNTFLTIKEAAEKVGKSKSTIRRVIYPILQDDHHADRHHIQPSVDEAREIRLTGEIVTWQLSEELLDREVTSKMTAAASTKLFNEAAGESPSLREIVILLRQQLEHASQQLNVKDQQIATLSEITKSLNERIGEGNVLLGSLQQKLALIEGPVQKKAAAHDAVTLKPPKPTKAGESRTPAPPKKAPPKKGFWQHLFS